MDLNLIFDGDTLIDKELLDWSPVIALKLDDRSCISTVLDCSVAAPGLPEGTHDLLAVQVIWKSFDESQAFSCISLLKSDV